MSYVKGSEVSSWTFCSRFLVLINLFAIDLDLDRDLLSSCFLKALLYLKALGIGKWVSERVRAMFGEYKGLERGDY